MGSDQQASAKKVIAVFFLGLLLMLALELFLIWILNQVVWLPKFDRSWQNTVPGLLAAVAGVALVIWSVRVQYMEGKGTPYPKVATRKLVTTGPYACTRNPMTLGAGIFYLGIAVWMGSMSVIGIILIVFTVLLRYIYVYETVELTRRFGEEYQTYRLKTPFLFPRLVRHK